MLIGSGTYGQVYRIDGDQIRKEMKLFGDQMDTTVNECSFLSSFTHIPFIPHKISIEIHDNNVSLIQSNGGIDLDRYCQTASYRRRLTVLPRIICQMARMLIWMKQIHVAHMDIKPQNLCINRHYYLTLIDWGFVIPINRNTQGQCGTYLFSDPCNQYGCYAYDMFGVGMTLAFS